MRTLLVQLVLLLGKDLVQLVVLLGKDLAKFHNLLSVIERC